MGRYSSWLQNWPSNETLPVYDIELGPLGAMTVSYVVSESSRGEVSLYPEGIVITKFGGTQMTDQHVEQYIEHAVSIWQPLVNDYTTRFKFNNKLFGEPRIPATPTSAAESISTSVPSIEATDKTNSPESV